MHALEAELQHEKLKSRPTTPIRASNNSDPAELAMLLDLDTQAENEVLRELVKDLKAQPNTSKMRNVVCLCVCLCVCDDTGSCMRR